MNFAGYEVSSLLHSSASHTIYRATRQRDQAPVVIKAPAIDGAGDASRLAFEFRLLNRLIAPGVIRAVELLELDGGLEALVLEDFRGESLSTQVGRRPALEVLEIALGVCGALAVVHAQGIVHKDVNPSNILRNPVTGEVKLADFHLATELSRERREATAARLEGSLPYIAPEQTGRVNRDLDYRADYYSLGISLFELVTGQTPFSAEDSIGWVHAHISKRAPSASDVQKDVPLMLSRIIQRLIEKNPDERYQSTHGLLQDLTRCRDELAHHGAIQPFELGTRDVSPTFQVSQNLIGREAEVRTLLTAYDNALNGKAGLLLVAGFSGVGKSSVVKELQKPVVTSHGYFVTGKFDQLGRNVPYDAWLQAIRNLCLQVLAESEARLGEYRNALALALGNEARVLVELVPELEKIVGAQPPAAELAAGQTRHRLKRVFRRFLGVFATREHPLVIFLDDLQWLDAATPELLIDLFAEAPDLHLLVVGAYRSNEVDASHLLCQSVAELNEVAPGACSELEIGPLSLAGVNQIVATTLHCTERVSLPLAERIFEKSEGNPFFTTELLETLHREGTLQLDVANGQWCFDLARVERVNLSADFAQAMGARLHRLPDATLAVLRVAACIGHQFQLRSLAQAVAAQPSEVAEALWPAVEQRLVYAPSSQLRERIASTPNSPDLDEPFAFAHDRIQQAAYGLIDTAEQARIHLEVGRQLLWALGAATHSKPPSAPGETHIRVTPHSAETLMSVVGHLNRGRQLMSTPSERLQLLELNLQAARRAKASAAFGIATEHLTIAEACLDDSEWTAHVALHVRLLGECAECAFASGEIAHALEACDRLLQLAPSDLDKANAYFLKAGIVEHQARMLDALELIRAGLRLVGIELPTSMEEIGRGIGAGIAGMQAHLARVRPRDFVDLPICSDPAKVTAMNLLFKAIPAAIQTCPPLFILAELLMFDLALTHGTAAVSCKNFVDCGIIQGGIVGDYETAYELGEAAYALLDKYQANGMRGAVSFVFAAFVVHWRRPFSESLEVFRQAQRECAESGDLAHTAYAIAHEVQRKFAVGVALPVCSATFTQNLAQLDRLHAVGQKAGARLVLHAVEKLQRATPQSGEAAEDEAFLEIIRKTGNAQWLYSHAQIEAQIGFVLGDNEQTQRWLAIIEPVLPAGNALFSLADYHLIAGLQACRSFGSLPAETRDAALVKAEQHLRQLSIWAVNCPTNFEHKRCLLEAELKRVRGDAFETFMDGYDAAVDSAGQHFIQLRALARELQARAWMLRGNATIGRALLQEAHQLYAQWGARRKTRALETAHPTWFVSRREQTRPQGTLSGSRVAASTSSASNIDLESVFKATQAISSEVKSEALFEQLMNILVESAGAERGYLILDDNGRLELVATAGNETSERATLPLALSAASALCVDAVRYVVRTQEALVLGDASAEGSFQGDAHVRSQKVRSLLCMPILHQGQLMGVLYAENNAASQVFTPDRLGVLRMIASQAAISINNARLYEHLEEKVSERTRELADKNRQVQAMFDTMQQGVFLIDSELRILPQHSEHLKTLVETVDVVGEECLPLLFRDANISPDAESAMQAALAFSFGVPDFMAEANASHLIREFTRRSADGDERTLELDFSFIPDDDGLVSRVLIIARDVSLLRTLRAAAEVKTREADIIGQILDAGLERFNEFSASAQGYVEQSRTLLGAPIERRKAALETLFRYAHTIKGNARMLNYGYVVEHVHELEEEYAALRSDGDRALDVRLLLDRLARIQGAIEQYERVALTKLGSLVAGGKRLERSIERIQALVRDAEDAPLVIVQRIKSVLRELGACALDELVSEAALGVGSLARELGKPVPTVHQKHIGVMLSPEWRPVLRDVLAHALRNSLDHGIEAPDERTASGKPTVGNIALEANEGEHGITLHLRDDGRGLALETLRRLRPDVQADDMTVAERVFEAGVSTASRVSHISGRGVGMDVVRRFVREHGGDVQLVFTGSEQHGFRPFELQVTLPAGARLA